MSVVFCNLAEGEHRTELRKNQRKNRRRIKLKRLCVSSATVKGAMHAYCDHIQPEQQQPPPPQSTTVHSAGPPSVTTTNPSTIISPSSTPTSTTTLCPSESSSTGKIVVPGMTQTAIDSQATSQQHMMHTASANVTSTGSNSSILNGGGVNTSYPVCFGCNKVISERFLLKALDQLWHEDCLKCSCCDCRLGEVGSTLYTKANLILCKRDYLR